MNVVQKLRALHGEIDAAGDGFKVVDGWSLAGRLLSRLPVDQGEVGRVVKERDVAGLDALVSSLESGAEDEPVSGEADPSVSAQTLESAMGAFKRRLRIVRLNDESRLGGRYTSGGRRSGIDAIEPLREFGPEVWRELVRSGRLRKAGGGLLALGLDEAPAKDP